MTGPFEFTVPGCPVPWQRTGLNRKTGRFYTKTETRNYQRKVRMFAKLARVEPFEGEVAMRLLIFFPDKRTRDDDNVEKSIRDALQAGKGKLPVAFDNDRCVKEVHRYVGLSATNPRVEVKLWALEPGTFLEEGSAVLWVAS